MGIDLTHYLTAKKNEHDDVKLSARHRKIGASQNNAYLKQLILSSYCSIKFYPAIALMVGCLPNYGYLVKCRHALGLRQYFNFEV